jgi:molybdopterin biosynthesis enzyme MoaB
VTGAAADDLAPPGLRAKVLTVSDGVAAGVREDGSGKSVADLLESHGFDVVERRTIPADDSPGQCRPHRASRSSATSRERASQPPSTS